MWEVSKIWRSPCSAKPGGLADQLLCRPLFLFHCPLHFCHICTNHCAIPYIMFSRVSLLITVQLLRSSFFVGLPLPCFLIYHSCSYHMFYCISSHHMDKKFACRFLIFIEFTFTFVLSTTWLWDSRRRCPACCASLWGSDKGPTLLACTFSQNCSTSSMSSSSLFSSRTSSR